MLACSGPFPSRLLKGESASSFQSSVPTGNFQCVTDHCLAPVWHPHFLTSLMRCPAHQLGSGTPPFSSGPASWVVLTDHITYCTLCLLDASRKWTETMHSSSITRVEELDHISKENNHLENKAKNYRKSNKHAGSVAHYGKTQSSNYRQRGRRRISG